MNFTGCLDIGTGLDCIAVVKASPIGIKWHALCPVPLHSFRGMPTLGAL